MRRNTRYFVIGLLALTLLLTGAYAVLTATLNITGTAAGGADFKLEFTNVDVTDEDKATATTSSDNTTITITSNLTYPGDTVTTNFTITNSGTLPASVDDIVINNPASADFTVTINGLDDIEGTVLPVGTSTPGSIIITWNLASTNPTPASVDFDITMNFSQATI